MTATGNCSEKGTVVGESNKRGENRNEPLASEEQEGTSKAQAGRATGPLSSVWAAGAGLRDGISHVTCPLHQAHKLLSVQPRETSHL